MSGETLSREEQFAWMTYSESRPEVLDGRRSRADRASFVAGYRAAKAGDGQVAAFKRTHEFLQKKNVELYALVFELRRELRLIKRSLEGIEGIVRNVRTVRADKFPNLLAEKTEA